MHTGSLKNKHSRYIAHHFTILALVQTIPKTWPGRFRGIDSVELKESVESVEPVPPIPPFPFRVIPGWKG